MKKRDTGNLKPHFQEEGAAGKQRATHRKTAVKPVSFVVGVFFLFFLKDKVRLKNCFYGLRHKEEYEVKGRDGKNENG